MAIVNIYGVGTQTITQSGTDTVTFTGPGTLNITGTAGAPIDVELSQLSTLAIGATINITYANVSLDGGVGLALYDTFNIGTGGTFIIRNGVSASLGTSINFTGSTGSIVLDAPLNIPLADVFSGFGPGKAIDFGGMLLTGLTYVDKPTNNTGGVLTLRDSANNAVAITLGDGEFTADNFSLQRDGVGGTWVQYQSYVTGLTTSPGNGTMRQNGQVLFNVATSNAISILGTPSLLLNDGGVATYVASLSSATNSVFSYTVAAGENTPDLAVTGIGLNGATLSTVGGGIVNLSGVIGNPAGTLVIDTLAPVATAVQTNLGTGVYRAGQTVTFTVNLSEAVLLAGGTPTLLLSDGGTAVYDPTNSTATSLSFTHVVQAGNNTPDLAITGVSLNGATLADIAGNALNLASLVTNPAGTLVIDTLAPVATAVQTNLGTGVYRAGQTVTFTVNVSEAVLLTGGTPTLLLSDGGTAVYDPTNSTATSLSFSHVVQAGNNTPDLAITGVSLNGASLTDIAGNAFDLTSLVTNPAGTLQIDTSAPTVTGVTTNPGSGVLNVGQNVDFVVALSEAVIFAGSSPVLFLSDGGVATFDAANSTPTALRFTHTVQAGQNTADLAVTGAASTGVALADAAGNLLDLASTMLNPAGILQVVTSTPATPAAPPSVQGVTTNPGSGTVSPGDIVSFSIGVDHPIYVLGGVPTLALSDGGFAIYDPIHSTPTNLVFTTQIQPGQLASDLAVIGYDMHGSTIEDATGSTLSLANAIGNPAGVLQVIAAVTGNLPVGSSGGQTPVIANPISPVTPTTPATTGTGTTPVPSSMAVFRFFDSNAGTHFYTTSTTERDSILANRPDLIPEGDGGVGMRAVNPASGDTSAIPVYRFFDSIHGTQFLTASSSERDDIIANRSDLIYQPEGTFYEHSVPQATDTPVYRFFSSTDGTHFYTDSESERASLATLRPDLIAEGIGFYEPS